MKIIGGKFRSKNFYMPHGGRTTQNVVRKALFDTLGQDCAGMAVLDLFAGSGAVGFEAYSRGAEGVLLVEKEELPCRVIRDNLRIFGASEQDSVNPIKLWEMDSFVAIKELARRKETFDLIFADPPYSRDLGKKALKHLGAYVILRPDSWVVVQHDVREKLPETEGTLKRMRFKSFGHTQLSFYHA